MAKVDRILERLEKIKAEYYKKNGIQPNVIILGRENFTDLLKDKEAFRAMTLMEEYDKIDDLTILQVHNLKMFRVGHIE